MSFIQHALTTTRLGTIQVIVPSSWPVNYGVLLRVGQIASPPLVRIQSRCVYGEIFGSLHCDCAHQLQKSCDLLNEEGGLLFYLEQEGRGAGVTVKARAYMALEKTGVDTFHFFESLALPIDLRDYRPVAEALKELGITSIRLITSNPLKVTGLESAGIAVTPISVPTESNEFSRSYIDAKRSRGHLL